MKKTLLFILSLLFVGIVSAQSILHKAPVPLTDIEEDIYLLDSIHVYTLSEEITSRVAIEYDEQNREIYSELYQKNYEGKEYMTAYDSTYYDSNNNIILYKYFEPVEGEFICKRYEEKTYSNAGLIETIKEYIYSELTEEYSLKQEETYTYDENGFLLEKVVAIVSTGPVGPPGPPEPPMPPGAPAKTSTLLETSAEENRITIRSVYSGYIEQGKPGKEELYEFNSDYVTSYIIYTYDEKKNLITTELTARERDWENEEQFIETLQSKVEYSYNELSQVTEEIYSSILIGLPGLIPGEKTVYTYNAETNLLEKEENYTYARWLSDWELQSTLVYFWNKVITNSICHTEKIDNITIYYQANSRQLIIESDVVINKISLYTLEGQKVLAGNNGENTAIYSISVPNLPDGIYLLTITSDNKNTTKKILIHE